MDDDPNLWKEIKEKGGRSHCSVGALKQLLAGGRRPCSDLGKNGHPLRPDDHCTLQRARNHDLLQKGNPEHADYLYAASHYGQAQGSL